LKKQGRQLGWMVIAKNKDFVFKKVGIQGNVKIILERGEKAKTLIPDLRYKCRGIWAKP